MKKIILTSALLAFCAPVFAQQFNPADTTASKDRAARMRSAVEYKTSSPAADTAGFKARADQLRSALDCAVQQRNNLAAQQEFYKKLANKAFGGEGYLLKLKQEKNIATIALAEEYLARLAHEYTDARLRPDLQFLRVAFLQLVTEMSKPALNEESWNRASADFQTALYGLTQTCREVFADTRETDAFFTQLINSIDAHYLDGQTNMFVPLDEALPAVRTYFKRARR